MSVAMSLLAMLDEGPTFGLNLRNEFEARTGGVWPLNVGQVYTTLARLERDGLVRPCAADDGESHKLYQITDDGRAALTEWFRRPLDPGVPARDELVVKLIMAAGRGAREAATVIQAERKGALETLQRYTLMKREAPRDADMGWMFLLDSLIFSTEARVRWLDVCEARVSARRPIRGKAKAAAAAESEVRA